jgi:hypothetical protein
MTRDEVKALIRDAFADTEYPGDDALVRSQGDEPDEVVALFRGKTDWRALNASFVDLAGAASPSALSFFSPAAFRFYLPAYLIADLSGALMFTEPSFFLYFGVDDTTRDLRAGTQLWWEVQEKHFAPFTNKEAAAIVEYLRCKADDPMSTEHDQRSIGDALRNYWIKRATEPR